jgi:hypothetical protein
MRQRAPLQRADTEAGSSRAEAKDGRPRARNTALNADIARPDPLCPLQIAPGNATAMPPRRHAISQMPNAITEVARRAVPPNRSSAAPNSSVRTHQRSRCRIAPASQPASAMLSDHDAMNRGHKARMSEKPVGPRTSTAQTNATARCRAVHRAADRDLNVHLVRSFLSTSEAGSHLTGSGSDNIPVEKQAVLAALGALAQGSRLDIYGLFVQVGPMGLPAGQIGEQLGLPSAILAFHPKELNIAGWGHSRATADR